MRYLYEITELKVLCEVPYAITVRYESEQFLHSLQENEELPVPDLTVYFQPAEKLPDKSEAFCQEGCRYYVENKDTWQIYHCAAPGKEPYACMVWERKENGAATCYYLSGMEHYLDYSHNICDVIGLETLMRLYHGFLLHASFIRWKGQGILFSAPSGTGKSTQADLWAEQENAEIINGDRAAVRFSNGKWMAYGLPFAGSSRIYRNAKAPVAAIVALRQAKENHLRRLTPSEAIVYLYPEITVHRWDREFTEYAFNIMTELFLSVPVYLLECLPDSGAVDLLKMELEKIR